MEQQEATPLIGQTEDEFTNAARSGIDAMQRILDIFKDYYPHRDDFKLFKTGMVLAHCDNMPPGTQSSEYELNLVVFNVHVGGYGNGRSPTIVYEEVGDALYHLVHLAHRENDCRCAQTVEGLRLDLWSREWEDKQCAEVAAALAWAADTVARKAERDAMYADMDELPY